MLPDRERCETTAPDAAVRARMAAGHHEESDLDVQAAGLTSEDEYHRMCRRTIAAIKEIYGRQ